MGRKHQGSILGIISYVSYRVSGLHLTLQFMQASGPWNACKSVEPASDRRAAPAPPPILQGPEDVSPELGAAWNMLLKPTTIQGSPDTWINITFIVKQSPIPAVELTFLFSAFKPEASL
ncbi:hypothetical protein ACJZ2D_003998 [Fusarium nematophilum]